MLQSLCWKLLQIMSVLVVTNCTARKAKTDEVPQLPSRAWASLSWAIRTWVEQLEQVPRYRAAHHVYQGRSVKESLAAAQALQARLVFVSAGLGAVPADTSIPSYNLTLQGGSGAIGPHLQALGVAPSAWWAVLTQALDRPLQSHWASADTEAIYLALPSTYLALIADELAALADSPWADRTWVFTSARGRTLLPTSLVSRALPYDARLEVVGPSGTQSDFPQRALRHFIALSLPAKVSVDAAFQAVEQALSVAAPRRKVVRRMVSDDELIAQLRRSWSDQRGQSSRLLAHLRHDLGIACEQSRFRRLWQSVRQDIEPSLEVVHEGQ
jgi:hypothetical protein